MESIKIIILLIVIGISGCSQKVKQVTDKNQHITTSVKILNKKEAAKEIIEDNNDHFFDRVTSLEMSIQMKTKLKNDETDRIKYKDFLSTEVMDFTASEQAIITPLFEEVVAKINQLNPKLLPKNIKLVKIKTNHYGSGVYYTREECIFIPNGVINRGLDFRNTMIHELWHIISRYNPSLQEKAYAVFGFKKMCETDQLIFDQSMDKKLILNPDGTDYEYAIKLNNKWAMPFLISNSGAYMKNKNNFMNYIDFGLFYLSENTPVCTIKEDQRVPQNEMGSFFEQIGDNTNYIIHPDEISADNFNFALNQLNDLSSKKFSEKGQKQLDQMKEILKNHTI